MRRSAELQKFIDPSHLEDKETLTVDGLPLIAVASPSTMEELSRILQSLFENDLSVLVTGNGNRLHVGNPPTRADLRLSTLDLKGILEFDQEDGVIEVLAGTPLPQVRNLVNSEGWELPLDPPGNAPTLGGSLASAAFGPRFGHPRDFVLGLGMVMADGTQTKCGGRVIKNVTGYDLMKLYLGSYGSIGVIGSAWLRLLPYPESKKVLKVSFQKDDEGFKDSLKASRYTSVRVACLTNSYPILEASLGSDSMNLILEIAGDEKAVERDFNELTNAYRADEIDDDVLLRIRSNQNSSPGASDSLAIHFRVLPSKLPVVWSSLNKLGFSCFSYPNRGDLFASLDPNQLTSDTETLVAVRTLASDSGGSFVLERAPLRMKREFDVFGTDPSLSEITSSLKETFDPRGILNVGRVSGRN